MGSSFASHFGVNTNIVLGADITSTTSQSVTHWIASDIISDQSDVF